MIDYSLTRPFASHSLLQEAHFKERVPGRAGPHTSMYAYSSFTVRSRLLFVLVLFVLTIALVGDCCDIH